MNKWPRPIRHLLLLAVLTVSAASGQSAGFLAGDVRLSSGAPVPGAEVRIENLLTGLRQTSLTDDHGRYRSTALSPGQYGVTLRSSGLRTVRRNSVIVSPGTTTIIDLVSDVLPLQQEMTVTASSSGVADPNSVGLTVSRNSREAALPANGRDLHAFFAILPGAVLTPAEPNGGGQFTVGGQRPNSNAFRIDGASGNNGVGLVAQPGSAAGASLPAMTTIGGTQSLAGKEETERVEMRANDFSAEGGERPGALIAVDTKSGTNNFHASAFAYARPRFINSADPFAAAARVSLPPASLSGWGVAGGGPVWRNHTFLFGSFETLNIHDTAFRTIAVPTSAARSLTAPGVQAYLNAFPLPTGPALNAYEGIGGSPFSKDATVSNFSLRLDQNLGPSVRLFARYAVSPSSAGTQELGTADSTSRWQAGTVGFNKSTPGTTAEVRLHFSQAVMRSEHLPGRNTDNQSITAVGDALYQSLQLQVPLYTGKGPDPIQQASLFTESESSQSLFYPLPFSWSVTSLALTGAGQAISSQSGVNYQLQYEGAANVALVRGRHEYRFGADFIALDPRISASTATLSIASPGIAALLAGSPLSVTNFVNVTNVSALPMRASAFAQDTFRVSPRFTLTAGLRWELTPPLSRFALGNLRGYRYAGVWQGPGTLPSGDISSLWLGPPVVPNWPMRYGQVAPRVGLAYRLTKSGLVLRLGAGLYYDPALGSLINTANYNPLQGWRYFAPLQPASGPTSPAPPPTLFLPQVWQWRASLEQNLGKAAQLSASYFGSSGSRLLRPEVQLSPASPLPLSLFPTSHARANYQSFNLQWRANWRRLFVIAHYTWAHSIDTASSDTEPFLVNPQYRDAIDRGASSFDIRHLASVAVGSRLPASSLPGLRWLSRDWNISVALQTRTGFPFDVTSIDRSIGLGFANVGRPDLVPNQPLWLADGAVPGGRRLNSAAFSAVSTGSGALGRNVLRGPSLTQIDASLRRTFRLWGETGAEVSVSAYNLFNQRSFGNPVGYLGSALFGQPVSAASLMLGAGSPAGGLTPLFQSGAPRTVEFEFRLCF